MSKQSKQSRAGDRNGFAAKQSDTSDPKSNQRPNLGNMAEHRPSYNTAQAKSRVPQPRWEPQPRARLMSALRAWPSAVTSALQYLGTVTVLVQENELGTTPGILTSCKHCFGISK